MSALQEEDERTVFQPAAAPPAQPEGARRWRGELPAETLLNNIYKVRRFLARGGMGEVYEGVNVNTDERVAIKVMLPHLAADPKVQAMFRKEARILTELAHPALVRYRVLAHEPRLDLFYIVTEFIDGRALSEVMHGLEPSVPQLTALIRRLADGLAAAHALGAVHRDMSPDNVLLPQGRLDLAKIIDFGIAQEFNLAHQTVIGDGFAGKLGYVAPEQFGDFGRRIGPWTDVYSLGLVGLALAAGRAPDMGVTLVEAVDRRRDGVDLSPLPDPLRPVFQKMLAPDPTDRFQTMTEVIEALDTLERVEAPAEAAPPAVVAIAPADAPPLAESPPTAPETARTDEDAAPQSRSLKPWLLGAGVLAALVCAGLGLALTAAPRKPPAPIQTTVAISDIPEAKPVAAEPAADAPATPDAAAPAPAAATAAAVPTESAPPAKVAPPQPKLAPPSRAAPAATASAAAVAPAPVAAPPPPAPETAPTTRSAPSASAAAPAAAAAPANGVKVEACWKAVDGSWSYLGYATSAGCLAQVFSSCQIIHGRWGTTQFRRYDGRLESKASGFLAGWRTAAASQCPATATTGQ